MRLTYVPDTFPQISETFVLNEIAHMVRAGDEVTVIPRGKGDKRAWDQHDMHWLRDQLRIDYPGAPRTHQWTFAGWRYGGQVPVGKRPDRLWRHAKQARRIGEHVERILDQEADAIVCHFGYDNAVAAALAAQYMRAPLILWLHGSDLHTVPHRRLKWITSQVHCIVTNSQYSLGLIRQLKIDSPVVVAGLGVDVQGFGSDGEESREGQPTVVCVGRLGHNKNHERLLRVFSLVCQSIPEARLWLVGDGPQRIPLREYAERMNLSKNLQFLGQTGQSGVALSLKRGWVKALFSDKEGLGVAFMEAQACGLPCVASCVGGVPEVVAEDQTGHLFDFTQPEAEQRAANAMLELLTDSKKWQRMSEAAIAKARAEFDQRIHHQRVRETIQQAVNGIRIETDTRDPFGSSESCEPA